MSITSETSLQELFDYACKYAEIAFSGEQFIVRDLFRGIEWNRIPKGNRTRLGSMFLNYVSTVSSDVYQAIGKTPQNQQIYKKN